ncbi:polysaccharide deacetylase family protein [Candidatus Daviesbacteria bacterium]|nr:polysaccharide deacetylase family protein [Candidatus Daviesbacteria bacterium]
MGKKLVRIFKFNSVSILGIGIIIGVLLIWGLIQVDEINQKLTLINFPKPKLFSKAITQASSSALKATNAAPTAKSTAKISIPQNFGRTVNVPILMYHYIGNNPNPIDTARDYLSVPPDKFDAQMSYLASKGYTTISLDTLYAALKGSASLPNKPITLTFDDGYIDFYINAYPILKKYNFTAISFIPTGLMNQGYYLNWDQIREMHNSGLIIFEAHTVNHYNLNNLSYDKVKNQLTQSKQTLQDILGYPINFIAYPYGLSNPSVWQAAKEVGFVGGLGTWGGTIESEGNIMNMPRIRIAGSWSLAEFARRF